MAKLLYIILAFLASLSSPKAEQGRINRATEFTINTEEATIEEFVAEDGTDIDMSVAGLPGE